MKKVIMLLFIVLSVCSFSACSSIFAESFSDIDSNFEDNTILPEENLPLSVEDDSKINYDAIDDFNEQFSASVQGYLVNEIFADFPIDDIQDAFLECIEVYAVETGIDISNLTEAEMEYLFQEFLFGIIGEF